LRNMAAEGQAGLGSQGVAAVGELTGGVELAAPGVPWTDVAGDVAAGVAVEELWLLTAAGAAALPDAEGVAAGLAEAGACGALFTAAGVAALPEVAAGTAGVAVGTVAGSLTTAPGAACKGAAASLSGRSGVILTSVGAAPFGAAAALVPLAGAGFAAGGAAAI